MSLAPTLLTLRVLVPLAGTLAVGGLEVGTDVRTISPAPATVTLVAATVPTILTQTGPTAAPDASAVALIGHAPSLGRTLLITPALPDVAGETNDLTPTLVWGGGAAPDRALVTVGGLVPAVVIDGGQRIYPPAGSVLISPQAPTVVPPDAQVPLREPTRAQLGMIELAPTLVTGMTLALPASVLTAQGYAPQLVGLRYGWQPLPPAAAPGWTEVPRV